MRGPAVVLAAKVIKSDCFSSHYTGTEEEWENVTETIKTGSEK